MPRPTKIRHGIPWGLAVLGAATVLRVLFGVAMDLMPQDAYYLLYAERPALSYHDHPPLIGWLLWTAIALLGKTELAVRATTLVTTLLMQLAFGWLAVRFYGRKRGGVALAWFAVLPMCSVLSVVTTPDVPLMLAWCIALLGLEAALLRDTRGGWLVAGLGMGLAALSKYTAIFLPAGMILFLVFHRRHRRRLRSFGPWTSLTLAGLFTLPVALWNLRHAGASFGFQARERLGALGGLDLDDVLGFLLTQAISVLPLPLFALLLWAFRGLWIPRFRALDDRERFLWCFSAPLLLTALALSPFLWVKLNWPMPAFVTGMLLVVPRLDRGRAGVVHLSLGVAIHALIALQVFLYPIPVESNDTWFGWARVAEAVERRHGDDPSRFVFSTDGYKTAAELRFYSDLPEVHGLNVVGCPALQLDYLDGDLGRLAGRDALLVISEPGLEPSHRNEAALDRVRLFFESLTELPPVQVTHRGRRARWIRFFEADGYRGPRAAVEHDRRATEPCRFSPR